jgi:predicted membrane chloride channel (bestrophin family)
MDHGSDTVLPSATRCIRCPTPFAESLIGFLQLHLYCFVKTVQTVQALLANPPLMRAAKFYAYRWARCSEYAYEGSC